MLIHFPFVAFSFGSGANWFSPFKLCLVLALVVNATLKEMLSRANIDEQKVGKAIGRWKLWHDPIGRSKKSCARRSPLVGRLEAASLFL
jgi:hypothetical protein